VTPDQSTDKVFFVKLNFCLGVLLSFSQMLGNPEKNDFYIISMKVNERADRALRPPIIYSVGH
jgi:hypothetical protein